MQILRARYLIRPLVERGVVPAQTRRVVIDACLGSPVAVYVELDGSDELLEVIVPALEGVEIKVVGKEEPDAKTDDS